MKTTRIWTFFAVATGLTAALSAFAGVKEGGGGSAVVCFNDRAVAERVSEQHGMVTNEQLSAIESIELLDLFEWKRPRGIEGKPNLPLAQPRAGESYSSFLKRITDRAYNTIGENTSNLQSAIGNYLYTYEAIFRDVAPQNVMWTGTSLVHLQDEGTPMRFGGNCALVPMAVQQESAYELRLFVDDRLFFHPKHSVQSQAALFVHEFVYAMGRDVGQKDSSLVRRAVGWVMQNDPDTRIVNVLGMVQSLGFRDPSPLYRQLSGFSELHLFSRVLYYMVPRQEVLVPLWNDDTLRAGAGRSEREVVAELRERLAQAGIPVRERKVFNANKAVAYVKLLPASAESAQLERELTDLVQERGRRVREAFRKSFDHAEPGETLRSLPYVPAAQVQPFLDLLYGPVLDELAGLGAATGTEQEWAARRQAQQERYGYPAASLEDLVELHPVPGEKYQITHAWVHALEVFIHQANDNYRTIDIWGLRMPTL